MQPGHAWKIVEDEKHLLKNFGIRRFTSENYEKLKRQKHNQEILKPVEDDGNKKKKKKKQTQLYADIFCIGMDPNYDIVHNPDYFFDFNIQTLQEEIMIKALLMLPMVEPSKLKNIRFDGDLCSDHECKHKEPSMLR